VRESSAGRAVLTNIFLSTRKNVCNQRLDRQPQLRKRFSHDLYETIV